MSCLVSQEGKTCFYHYVKFFKKKRKEKVNWVAIFPTGKLAFKYSWGELIFDKAIMLEIYVAKITLYLGMPSILAN